MMRVRPNNDEECPVTTNGPARAAGRMRTIATVREMATASRVGEGQQR